MQQKPPLSLSQIAELTFAKLVGNPDHLIHGVNDLSEARADQAAFLALPTFTKVAPRYLKAIDSSQAGAVFVHPSIEVNGTKNLLLCEDPSKSFQALIQYFKGDTPLSGFSGIHPTAVIHPSARIAENVQIGPLAVIDENVEIKTGSTIATGVYIGPEVKIGTQCIIHPRVVIREGCMIGDRVVIQPGAVIGSCGFGFFTDAKGEHTKIDQLGIVVIENDVEVGANTTIDRARFGETRIGKGTKIDNLVQIGHGVILGQHNLIVAQTGIAGSTKTGRTVVIGGQCAINGHIEIGDFVMIAARSGVSKTLTKPGKYNGVPAEPLEKYNRNAVYLRNIEKFITRINNIEQTISKLTNDNKY